MKFICLYVKIILPKYREFSQEGEKYEKLFKDEYLISGHTHVYNLEGKHLNPGSVGIPKINKEHTCILYKDKTFYLINLENLSIIKETKINEE